MPVDHGDGHHHIAGYAEGGDPAEQSEEQADAPEKFGADGQKCERGGDVRLLSEEAHSTSEAVPAEPAESLLSAMGKKDYTEDQAKNGDGRIASGVDEL